MKSCSVQKKSLKEANPPFPFVIKCLSEQCTVVHAGANRYTASALDDEIAKGTEFGKKLKTTRDEVALL